MILATTTKMAILMIWTVSPVQLDNYVNKVYSVQPNSVQSQVVPGNQCAVMQKAIQETGVHAKCVYFNQQIINQ